MKLSKNLRGILILVALTIGIAGAFISCRKEKLEDVSQRKAPALRVTSQGGEAIIDVEDGDPDYDAVRMTIVGDQYEFPFKTETIRQAWNNLSPNDVSQLASTHNYVKFTPQSMEELVALRNSGLHLFDYPLDHEIIEMGDMLTGTTESTIPELYTFASVDSALPQISHDVLYGVRFIAIESIVAEEAFRLSGLEDKYPYHRIDSPSVLYDSIPSSVLLVPLAEHLGWWKVNDHHEPYTGGNGGYNNSPLNFSTSTPSDVVNACNCNRNSDDRYPSGCILVEETQFSPIWQGVRSVQVDFMGPYGQFLIQNTNQGGCFKASNKIAYKVWNPFGTIYLPVFMRVTFSSGEAKVSSLVPGTLVLATMPVCHIVGNVANWGLNNITIRYNRSPHMYSMPAQYYNAATLNNAHYEFIDMQFQDGIQRIPGNMSYLLQPFNGTGAALMLRQMSFNGSIGSLVSSNTILHAFQRLPVIGFSLANYMRINPVDIVIGIDRLGGLGAHTSDKMRAVMYHELGHAAHYRKTGHVFWRKLILYEALQAGASAPNVDPYGNGTDPDADLCALAEMWGQHIGQTYAHRRYGINHSLWTGSATLRDKIETSRFATLELYHYLSHSFIPEGALHDLMDNNVQNSQPPSFIISEHASVGTNDNIAGFTNLQFYQELSAANINDFISQLKSNQLSSTGNSVASFNTLWASYGY